MIALCLAIAALGFSPGPAVFAVIGRGLTQNLRTVFIFISGILLGDLLFAFLAMVGLAALAQSYTTLYLSIKIIGGLYLVYLGLQSFKKAKAKDIESKFSEEKPWQLLLSGFFLTSSNPKDLLFFVTFLPAFVNLKTITAPELFMACTVITGTLLGTLSFYALSADLMRKKLSNADNITHLNRLAGFIMMGAGVYILLK